MVMGVVRTVHSSWYMANSSYVIVIMTTAFYSYNFAVKYKHFFKSVQHCEEGIIILIYLQWILGYMGSWIWSGSLELNQTQLCSGFFPVTILLSKNKTNGKQGDLGSFCNVGKSEHTWRWKHLNTRWHEKVAHTQPVQRPGIKPHPGQGPPTVQCTVCVPPVGLGRVGLGREQPLLVPQCWAWWACPEVLVGRRLHLCTPCLVWIVGA